MRIAPDREYGDHESGIEGFSVDKGFVLRTHPSGNMSGQLTKDMKDSNVGFEGELARVHPTARRWSPPRGGRPDGGGSSPRATLRRGEDAVEVLRGEQDRRGSLRVPRGRRAGLGTKLENRWKVTPGAKLVVSAGAVSANKDVAYGGNCEAILRHWDDLQPQQLHGWDVVRELARRRRAGR